MSKNRNYILWAGSEESFDEYLAAREHWSAQTPEQAGVVLTERDAEKADSPLPRLLSISDGVGVISINGTLVSEDNWWNRFAGFISYNEIRAAALEALTNPSVKEVLLDIASPGGAVAGILDAVESLSALAKAKRVTAYTDSVAHSGGYWLFSTARSRFASPVASVGSIGVIFIHTEFSRMDKAEGITRTVFRAGKYKALANPVEPLSKLAEEEINSRLDHLYGVFVQSVADNLGVTYQIVDERMAQGRTFIGTQAVDAGLIDDVSNFDKVYAAIVTRAAKQGDASMKTSRYTKGALQAAAASGAISAEELEKALAAAAEDGEDVTTGEPMEPQAQEPEGAEDQEPDVGEGAEGAEDEPAVEGAEDEPTAEDDSSVVVLQKQLDAANDKLVDAKVEIKTLQTQVEELTKVVDPLKLIVAESVNTMLVALGQAADGKLSEADAKVVLSRHEAVAAQFVEAFKVGGVGSVEAEGAEDDASDAPDPDPVEAAAVKAAGQKVIPLSR